MAPTAPLTTPTKAVSTTLPARLTHCSAVLCLTTSNLRLVHYHAVPCNVQPSTKQDAALSSITMTCHIPGDSQHVFAPRKKKTLSSYLHILFGSITSKASPASHLNKITGNKWQQSMGIIKAVQISETHLILNLISTQRNRMLGCHFVAPVVGKRKSWKISEDCRPGGLIKKLGPTHFLSRSLLGFPGW